MKKLIALSLAALMLLFALVSCSGNQTDGPVDGPDDTVIETVRETNKWGDDQVDLELPEELDYQGVEIGIACRPETRYRREISVDKQSDPLDMQIALRNQWVQKFLNVKMKFIESYEMWGNTTEWNIPNYVKTQAEAGALSPVDIISANAAYTVAPDMRPYLVNLNGDQMTYMNINKAYWNQSYVSEATCYGQLYYIVGDLTLTIYDKAIVTFVNLDDAADAGMTAESFYDAVNNKEWTFEKYANLATNYPYLDNNNNRTVDAGDQIRLSTISWSEAVDGYYAAFNLQLLKENEDGSHTITVDGNDTLKNGARMVQDLYNNQGIFLGDTGSAIARFFAGDSLFHVDILYRNAEQNQQLRNVDFNYAILPLPMYSTDQGAYYTSPQDAYNALSVLNTHEEKFEAISAFLEAMASKSYDDIRPFYIEKMVKGEYAADAASVKMIEIIMDGIIFETAFIYSFQVERYAINMWRNCSKANGSDVDTDWAGRQEQATNAIRMFDMWFAGTANM